MKRPAWLEASDLRVGLGCMRMSTEPDRDEALAAEAIMAAFDAGITVFDTAHAYGRGEDDLGHNERLLGRTLAGTSARVVTKGGMSRPGGAWVPDGRAKAIRRDCEASLEALDGLPIDLYLLHAPDPRTVWRTSVRALGRLLDAGRVRRVGLSNVNRAQLDEAVALAPIAAVQVALSLHDDRALRGGIVERCEELGIAVIAHSPLGGPRRARRLARRTDLAVAAAAQGATPAELALAWLLALSPAIVAIPGARRPETARSAARAARLPPPSELDLPRPVRAAAAARASATPPDASATPPDASATTPDASATTPDASATTPPGATDPAVVLIMGIPGAGKTRLAECYAARGYLRLNRDERGGGLRALADELDQRLRSGARRVVLDNTYLTRHARSYVVDAAARHGVPVRCVWLDTPLAQAQVNLVERLLERLDALPMPEDLRALARTEPGALAPTQQMRALRELEPPDPDEGFAALETIPFARTPPAHRPRTGVFVAAAALDQPGWEGGVAQADADAPHLVFDWSPGAARDVLAPAAERLRTVTTAPVDFAVCPHGAGPPVCWCRPPLPGLPLAFARTHGIDPARSILIGTSTAHRTLAATLGARFQPAS